MEVMMKHLNQSILAKAREALKAAPLVPYKGQDGKGHYTMHVTIPTRSDK